MDGDPDLVLDALGDPSRRRLLEVLRDGEQPVGRIAERLPIGRPAVSKHLAVLAGAGLVLQRRHGTRNLYALAPDGLAPLQQWLARTWDGALAEFARPAEAEAAGDHGGNHDGHHDRSGPASAGADATTEEVA